MDSVAVAFSGGLDSATLAYLAFKILGKKAIAFTTSSPLRASCDLKQVKQIARYIGIRHHFISTEELQNKRF
ncbi:MAG: hypothetical protein DRP68_04405 [Candidatus Omnitrophota bacterium]|nr:MAG: hypothetical protein DRP68_04405 [Candidatus Omnitrophota bacterium]